MDLKYEDSLYFATILAQISIAFVSIGKPFRHLKNRVHEKGCKKVLKKVLKKLLKNVLKKVLKKVLNKVLKKVLKKIL